MVRSHWKGLLVRIVKDCRQCTSTCSISQNSVQIPFSSRWAVSWPKRGRQCCWWWSRRCCCVQRGNCTHSQSHPVVAAKSHFTLHHVPGNIILRCKVHSTNNHVLRCWCRSKVPSPHLDKTHEKWHFSYLWEKYELCVQIDESLCSLHKRRISPLCEKPDKTS